MSCIACLTSLTHLGLSRTYCSDSLAFNNSLAGLASLSRLRHLDLSNTEVDGSGLEKFCTALQVGASYMSLCRSWGHLSSCHDSLPHRLHLLCLAVRQVYLTAKKNDQSRRAGPQGNGGSAA